jgi:hypothetical protein
MINSAKQKIYGFFLLVLLALPLVWYSGTTWDSDSDHLMPTLISIENWRFLFWGQSRFGTLVPLLAKPFSEMSSNLLFQNFIHAFSLIVFVFAVSQIFYRYRGKSTSQVALFLILIPLFCLLNPTYLKHLISGVPYAAPLGLFGLCLLLINSNLNKWIILSINVLLIAISCWTNPLNGYYLLPLLLAIISMKKFKNVFHELSLTYLLFNFGLFFIILGVANGEVSGTVAPSLKAFQTYNWWLPLFLLQVALIVVTVARKNFKKRIPIFLGFAYTWISIFALTSLKHISINQNAPRYFITAAFVSMCITMILVEEELSRLTPIKKFIGFALDLLKMKFLVVASLIVLLFANILISRNLLGDYPLREPQRTLMTTLFKNSAEPYRFASGDFWYAWPTKLFVSHPEEMFITSFRSEFQYDTNSDSKVAIQSRLEDGDLGLCFGDLKFCKSEISRAVYRMHGGLSVRAETTDEVLITRTPIEVHSLRLKITLR